MYKKCVHLQALFYYAQELEFLNLVIYTKVATVHVFPTYHGYIPVTGVVVFYIKVCIRKYCYLRYKLNTDNDGTETGWDCVRRQVITGEMRTWTSLVMRL